MRLYWGALPACLPPHVALPTHTHTPCSCIHNGRYCAVYDVPEQHRDRYSGAQVGCRGWSFAQARPNSGAVQPEHCRPSLASPF